MSVAPAARRRPGARATNVATDAPLVPAYENEGRKFVRANLKKNEMASAEKVAKAECNKSMVAANISSFTFMEGNTTYDAVIAAGTEEKVSTEKLYGKVQSGEISLDQFVSMVTATQKAVKDMFGTNMLNSVLDTKPKDAELSIKARK
jgi:hypothetical protein